MDLEDTGCRARWMIRDRDGKYPGLFDAVLADAGIKIVLTGVRMPRMNAIMERWVLTCRRELLDRTLIWNRATCSRRCASSKPSTTAIVLTRASTTPAHALRCPRPSPNRPDHPAGRTKTPTPRRNPQRVRKCRMTCTDEVFGRDRGDLAPEPSGWSPARTSLGRHRPAAVPTCGHRPVPAGAHCACPRHAAHRPARRPARRRADGRRQPDRLRAGPCTGRRRLSGGCPADDGRGLARPLRRPSSRFWSPTRSSGTSCAATLIRSRPASAPPCQMWPCFSTGASCGQRLISPHTKAGALDFLPTRRVEWGLGSIGRLGDLLDSYSVSRVLLMTTRSLSEQDSLLRTVEDNCGDRCADRVDHLPTHVPSDAVDRAAAIARELGAAVHSICRRRQPTNPPRPRPGCPPSWRASACRPGCGRSASTGTSSPRSLSVSSSSTLKQPPALVPTAPQACVASWKRLGDDRRSRTRPHDPVEDPSHDPSDGPWSEGGLSVGAIETVAPHRRYRWFRCRIPCEQPHPAGARSLLFASLPTLCTAGTSARDPGWTE